MNEKRAQEIAERHRFGHWADVELAAIREIVAAEVEEQAERDAEIARECQLTPPRFDNIRGQRDGWNIVTVRNEIALAILAARQKAKGC